MLREMRQYPTRYSMNDCMNFSDIMRRKVCKFKEGCDFMREIQKSVVEFKLTAPLSGKFEDGERISPNYVDASNMRTVYLPYLEGVKTFEGSKEIEEKKRENELFRLKHCYWGYRTRRWDILWEGNLSDIYGLYQMEYDDEEENDDM